MTHSLSPAARASTAAAPSEEPDQAPAWAEGILTSRPSASRVYDYLLGGCHNFAVDRELAKGLIAAEPNAPEYARTNRAFLHRAVRFLLDAGVRQFLDLGSGIPTVGNVHEIVRRTDPDARVVYVDIDPVAIAHSQQLLARDDHAAAIQADLRRPDELRRRLADGRWLDLDQPVGLLMVAVLHFVPDADDPAGIVARWRELVAPGSYLAVSHACPPPVANPRMTAALDAYRGTATPLTLRSPAQVAALFAGWQLLPPGLVEVGRWRPDEPDDPRVRAVPVPGVAGVARRPRDPGGSGPPGGPGGYPPPAGPGS